MAIPKRALLLSSAAFTFFSFRYAPQVALFPRSYFWNITTLFLLGIFAQLCWSVILYPLFLSPLRHLPQPPDAHVLLGHFRRIFKDPSGEPQRDWIDTVPNDGVLYYRWLFNEPRVLVTNPKALGEVLVQRSYDFVKPERLRNGLGRLLGVGILLAEGDEHKRQRKMLMPAFSFRHVKDLYPIFWSKAQEMTNGIAAAIKNSPDASSVVEIRDWASRATLDIIGVAGMGRDFDSLTNPANELNATYRQIFAGNRYAQLVQLLLSMLPHWLAVNLPLKRNDEIGNAVSTIKKVARDLIREKRTTFEKGGDIGTDILSVAMESGGFSDEDLVNQLMTFLAAGHETTASATIWAVYLLCKHPDVQTRLREEIRTELPALSNSNSQISSAEIDRLPYLNAVLQETMRIFPPVPLTLRETAKDTTIQGHFIPARTTIIICPWAINTSVHLWGADAREFNPERWLGSGRANTGGAESNYAITTFLHGPRSCIGKDFAKAEFACLVASLVGRFELEFEDQAYELKIQGGITAGPKGGLRVRIRGVGGSREEEEKAEVF
ncbi:cytochrome P450 [Cucurbitaria berberidis CBS 394.84]|uniref:Cytochrome P450 n=1 Tax=Cucurbitaria berberidis CBS 394.84 TaxID=1168544 RepID=A0A9P4LDA7_9PLEO|nr:cytochrome P450 [Cucurbitaria berberidis CBS 394.84]KAF1850192.1 cytochrome P450 [Cucurbitaria berberidis CBS 394.84]